MAQNLGNLLRVAIENSQGPPASISNPEDAAWLKEALSASTVDLVKQMSEDISRLQALLSASDSSRSEMQDLMDELLNLTEDLDLANDFFKVGGTNLLLALLFNEPAPFRLDALQLLANLVQNNPEAQQKCHDKDILPRLLLMLEEKQSVENFEYAAKLVQGISCLVRTCPTGISIFRENNGFKMILDVLKHVTDNVPEDKKEQIDRLVTKASFLIFGTLQDMSGNLLTDTDRQNLLEQIVSILMKNPTSQEYLMGSAILLVTKCENVECGISKLQSDHTLSIKLPSSMNKDFSNWLIQRHLELGKINDSANTELQSYIDCLQKVF